MATAKFKISDLTDNITSDELSSNPTNYDLIINDISGSSAETKKIGLDTLKAGIFGTNPGTSDDIFINGKVGINVPDGTTINQELEVYGNVKVNMVSGSQYTTGALTAQEFFLDTSSYSVPPEPGSVPGSYIPGYSFTSDGSNDTGMFWDGDDRVYLNARDRPGLIVAGRKRATNGQGIIGDAIDGVVQTGQAFVGMGVINPECKLHVMGNVWIQESDDPEYLEVADSTGTVLAREYFVNVGGYTAPPQPGQNPGSYIPGYSFADVPGGGPGGEGFNDTGMFWDGDDRVYLNAKDRPGIVIAARDRATSTNQDGSPIRGPIIDPDSRQAYVGMGVINPRHKLHVEGDVRIDKNSENLTPYNSGQPHLNAGGLIMQNANGNYYRITVNAGGNGFDFENITPPTAPVDVQYEDSIRNGMYYGTPD